MGASEEEIEHLRRDVEKLRGDINVLLSDVRELGAHRSSEAMERARKASESVLEEARTLYGRADDQIRKDPLTSILVSFGVGFIVGKLLQRRR